METNNEEIVALLNRLLEKLHQADSNSQGSIVINVYSSGSLHVDHVDTQHFYGDACPIPQKEKRNEDTPTLPLSSELSTLEAIKQSIILLMEERYEDKLLFNRQAHWQAIYRILVDKGYWHRSDYPHVDRLAGLCALGTLKRKTLQFIHFYRYLCIFNEKF